MYIKALFFCVLVVFCSCSDSMTGGMTSSEDLPKITIRDAFILESANAIILEVRSSVVSEEEITIDYRPTGITAEENVDFEGGSGSIVLAPGVRSAEIVIPLINDDIKEIDEKLEIVIFNATNAVIDDELASATITDDDVSVYDQDGYTTPNSFYGYEMAWQDEYEGQELSSDDYNYEMGDGCPNICGWGNNELQFYTSDAENVFLEDGKLIIKTAIKDGQFRSGRLTTKDKKEFKYGRIDIRAKITKGQGLWPAIWMLGKNIDEVGWPACGEIDIMENVGHVTRTCYGTAHWGPQGRGFSTYVTGEYSIRDEYADAFHVFTIVWTENNIDWYIDENKFHTVSPSITRDEQYRFNQEFFLILNVAVGGNWPGNPDDSTVFPQQMEIDYIRVFQ